jgi:hypothetical protein
MKILTNDSGLSIEIVKSHEMKDWDKFLNIFGGDNTNPSWEEYFDSIKEELKPHILLLRKSILENSMIGWKGQDVNDLYFRFSDGVVFGFSWRAWGDLMQAIVDKKEGYMAYYM